MTGERVADRTNIAERVRFWEEQDRINQALIPRVVALYESQERLAQRMTDLTAKIVAESRAAVAQEVASAAASAAIEAQKELMSRMAQEMTSLRGQLEQRCTAAEHDTKKELVALRVALESQLAATQSGVEALRTSLENRLGSAERFARRLAVVVAIVGVVLSASLLLLWGRG